MKLPMTLMLIGVSCSIVHPNAVPPESVALVKSIYNFYKPSGIIIVYDANLTDFSVHRSLFSAIRRLSRDYILSQVVSYQELELITRYTSDYEVEENEENELRWLPPLDPLYMLIVKENENLEHFKSLSANLPKVVADNPWFVYIDNENEELKYFDCGKPRGNPLHLRLDSRVMVKCSNDNYLRRYYSITGETTMSRRLRQWRSGKSINPRDMQNDYHKSTRMKWFSKFTFKVAKQRSSIFDKNPTLFVNTIIKELGELSVFNFDDAVEEDILGYRTDNKSWIGLMKIMKEKRADIAAAMFSMSKTRMLAIDFTIPLVRAKCGVYAKLPEFINIQWSAYYDVLGTRAWLIIMLLILVISAVLNLLQRSFRRSTVFATLFFENIINVCGVFMQQGSSDETATTTIQTLYISMFISSLILNAVYSALITSYIAVLKPTLPFKNYIDFLNNGMQFKVVAVKGSRDEDLIMSLDDQLMSPLKGRLEKRDLLPIYFSDGFVQACQEKVAYYSNDVYYEGINGDPPCNLGFLVSPRYEFLSLGLVKNSAYTETINYFILRLMNNGIINRLKKKYFYKYTEAVENKSKYITLWEVLPILSIWALGVFASFVILLMEIAVRSLYCKRRKRSGENYLRSLLINKKTGCRFRNRKVVKCLNLLLSKKKTG